MGSRSAGLFCHFFLFICDSQFSVRSGGHSYTCTNIRDGGLHIDLRRWGILELENCQIGDSEYFGLIREHVIWLAVTWSMRLYIGPYLVIADMSNVDWSNLGLQKIALITLSTTLLSLSTIESLLQIAAINCPIMSN